MRIAVFHNVSPGGARRVVLEEIKYLSNKHNVDLYITDPTYPEVFDMRKFCKNVINTHFSQNNKFTGIFHRLTSDLKVFVSLDRVHKNISRLINNGGYDVALIHPDEYLESPYLLKYLKIPSVYFCHEPLRTAFDERFKFKEKVAFYKYWYEIFVRFIKKIQDKNNIKHAHQIITESKYIKDAIRNYYNRKSNLIYLGVDSNVFKPNGTKEKSILFIGNKDKLEGYDLALNIMRLVNKTSEYELKVLDFNNKKIKITNDKKLALQYSRSFVTLCLDYGEPFGLKALESMACGTPVLAVDEGGYKESVLNSITGFLLPRNPKTFAQIIFQLEEDYKKYNRISKTGVRIMKERWTWEEHGRLLVKNLKSAIKEKRYAYE